MTLVEARPVPLPPSGLVVKMEERKRPASHDDGDNAPPLKRQATSKEEKSRKRDDADLPGGADIERFRKEAIYRQMLEFKREKVTLESRLTDATKLLTTRDDYIRQSDVFVHQFVDNARIQKLRRARDEPYKPVPAELLNANDFEAFKRYLDERGSALKAEMEAIAEADESTAASKEEMDIEYKKAQEQAKNAVSDVERARQERDQMIQRLETATQRYMIAEKKLDRAKSSTVQKLEQQAMASSRSEAHNSSDGQNRSDQTNGSSVDSEVLTRAEEARAQAESAAAKQKEQLEQLVSENEKLNSELTALRAKQSTLTDDDFAGTDLFKHLRTQHEEIIKRVNDLEATNIELRKEAERLQAERTSHKGQLEVEQQTAINERDLHLAKLEADLARIRAIRDELHAKVSTYETNEEQERASIEQLKKAAEAKDDRIKALQSELERLSGDQDVISTNDNNLSEEEVRKKLSTVEQKYSMLNQELEAFGLAYKKLQASIANKINAQLELEERVKRAVADKNKADQRYFAAMKAKDQLSVEIRALRTQAAKSTDLISGLRDAEQSSRALVQSYESQLAKANELSEQLTKTQVKVQSEATTQTLASTALKSQISDLKAQLDAKDATVAEARSAKRKAEVDVEELKASVQERDKRIEAQKKSKGAGADNDTVEMLRAIAMCTVCRKHFKDTVIKTCGHTMCLECVEERISSRSRRCPHCTKSFGRDDYMKITLS